MNYSILKAVAMLLLLAVSAIFAAFGFFGMFVFIPPLVAYTISVCCFIAFVTGLTVT